MLNKNVGTTLNTLLGRYYLGVYINIQTSIVVYICEKYTFIHMIVYVYVYVCLCVYVCVRGQK